MTFGGPDEPADKPEGGGGAACDSQTPNDEETPSSPSQNKGLKADTNAR